MRVGGILWGRRPPSAGGGPLLRRRPALRAGRRPRPLRPEGAERPKYLSPFRRFLITNGIVKAGHSKLDGCSATLPARRPSPGLPTVAAPTPPPTFFASMRSYRRPSTHRRTSANTRSVGLRRVGRPPLPPPSPCEKPHGPIPRPAPLLNRLAAELPSLSPTSIAPLVSTSTPPAISWLSEPLPPACKAGKTLLLDAFKLFSVALLYLLGSGWDIRIRLTGNGITLPSYIQKAVEAPL
jgi:hypothetical protein